jgi:DnaJ like chaperone protein
VSWWGKALGGAFGFLLGGPLGALLGAGLGHHLDQKAARGVLSGAGMGRGSQQRVQVVFFMATFSVMGHVAKADGRVSEDEIETARAVMARLGLQPELRQAAMRLFTQGKQPDFPLDDVLLQFKNECQRRRTLLQLFMEFLLMAAYADGVMHTAERRLLQHISQQLGFSVVEFERLETMVRAARRFEQGYRPRVQSARVSLADAFAVLNVTTQASDEQVKKAYRRLLSQHHPDKLVAKGLPEEMMKVAAERTHQIRSAYEVIREKRGF